MTPPSATPPPPRPAELARPVTDAADLARRFDLEFAAVVRRIDELAERTARRFGELSHRTAELYAHFDGQREHGTARTPPRPPLPPPVPPRPTIPPGSLPPA